jgi:hypothetical protein
MIHFDRPINYETDAQAGTWQLDHGEGLDRPTLKKIPVDWNLREMSETCRRIVSTTFAVTVGTDTSMLFPVEMDGVGDRFWEKSWRIRSTETRHISNDGDANEALPDMDERLLIALQTDVKNILRSL